MPRKSIPKNSLYSKKLKEIRPFVAFDFDLRKKLTPAQKAKITRYYKEIKPYIDSPANVQIYRPRKKSNLIKVQTAVGNDTRLKDLKVAFVPTSGDKVKIAVNRKSVTIKGEYTESHFIPLDPKKVAGKNAVEYINKRIEAEPYKFYSVQYGRFISNAYSADLVAEQVKNLANKYNAKEANNYYKNWLGGLYGIKFKNQKDAIEYVRRKNKAAKRIKRNKHK